MAGVCAGGGPHQPQRSRLNDWDDVTACSRCQQWITVHHNVRGKNPNFKKRGR